MKSILLAASVVVLTLSTPLFADSCPNVVFQTRQMIPPGSPADMVSSLESIDFDGDGVLDLVGIVYDSGYAENIALNYVLMAWKGNGDGTFQQRISLGNEGIRYVVPADVNVDGRMDLVLVASSGDLIVRLGNGTGFDAGVVTHVPYNYVTAVLFDGDSYPDLVIGDSNGGGAVLHGNGDGTFLQGPQLLVYGFPKVADFDGDGLMDIAYSVSVNQVHILFQNSDHTFGPTVFLKADPLLPNAVIFGQIEAADLDGDGRKELVVGNQSYGATAAEHPFTIYKFSSDRIATTLAPVPAGIYMDPTASGYGVVKVADVTGDGHLDLVVGYGSRGRLVTWVGLGDGSFRSPSYYEPVQQGYGGVSSITLGDFDHDGAVDLAMSVGRYIVAAKIACVSAVQGASKSPVINPDQSAPLRAVVAGVGPGTPVPRGHVTFREGTTVLGTAEVDVNGLAALDVPGLALGDHTIVADFDGNGEEAPSTSPGFVESVTTATTSISISVAATAAYGRSFTPTVSISTGGSQYVLEMDGALIDRSQLASITSNLATGTQHTFIARYEGDAYTAPSSSSPATVTIVKALANSQERVGRESGRDKCSDSRQFSFDTFVRRRLDSTQTWHHDSYHLPAVRERGGPSNRNSHNHPGTGHMECHGRLQRDRKFQSFFH